MAVNTNDKAGMPQGSDRSSVADTNATKGKKPSKAADGRDVGTALRVAYQQTVEENIPSEMLDLLGKLS